jgi:hypothetical protein
LTSVYSTGSSVYTLVKEDAEIHDLLQQIAQQMVRLSGDARALVMIDTLLTSLDLMGEAYARANETVPRLNNYWDEEADKIGIVIESLGSNVPPAGLNELARFQAAVAAWQRIAKVAKGLVLPEAVEPNVVPLEIKIRADA